MSSPQAPVHAVIFDCDGTLVDSEELGLAVLADHARSLGVPLAPGAEFALRGRSMRSNIQLFEDALGRPLPADFEAQARGRMADVFRARLQPMPAAREVLEQLRVPCC